MLCIRYHGPQDLRVDDISIPAIGPDELLIKTEAAAICGSDIRMWQSNLILANAPLPLVLGHEFAGVIVKAGRNVKHYREGMRVAIAPNFGCGTCDQCVSGRSHLCSAYEAFGVNLNGAFAEYVRIPETPIRNGNLVVLPPNVSSEEAALNEPLSCTYNGFTKCTPQSGESAMVIGAGPIGMMHAQLLHMAGLSVTVNDLSESRLDICKKILPFANTYTGSTGLSDYVYDVTNGRGMDVVIVACPVPAVQASTLALMNYGGRINFFGGVPKHLQPVAIDTNLIHYKELCLTGSTRSSVSQFRKTLAFIEQGHINVKSLITSRSPVEDGLTAFTRAKEGVGLKNVLTFPPVASAVTFARSNFSALDAVLPVETGVLK
ncbi:MAG: alcohol dehydrogenase catalytic domain-containing protein [Planctomycetia bacterium]|nr:alcohol dehydrogenase catalytic domain-containing protein [Planctomycetia bacterium]